MTLPDFCAEALGNRGNSEAGAGGMARQSFDAAEPGWPIIEDDAYYGIAGDIVRTFDPHTEAHPVGILIQFLAHFGNVIGKSPYYQVEAERHHANLYIVLVGRSAKARKGVSGNRVRSVMRAVDDRWIKDRIKSGLSSGEGLINEVRDAFETDSGIPDKRLLIIEAEFANALAVMERPGNTLSSTIRKAWDGDDTLSTMSKNSPLKATAAHISIVGHITEDELRARITRTDAANGFANRYLFMLVHRSKSLPFGGNLADAKIGELAQRVQMAAETAKMIGRTTMTDAARQEWVRSTNSYPLSSRVCWARSPRARRLKSPGS
jgi:hypothetical protein